MGYYASGSGCITFAGVLNDRMKDRVSDILSDVFEYDVLDEMGGPTSVSIWASEKYYGDAVEATLNDVANATEIDAGELEYVGEDGSLWRFLYKKPDNIWVEQNGHVVYDE